MAKNPWMISTVVLAIALAIVSIYTLSIATRTPAELTAEEAKNKAMDYINENLVQPGTRANAVSVEVMGSVYKVVTEYEGQLIPVYITREGSYLFLTSPINTSQQLPTPTPTPTPEVKAEKLEQFIACLNQSGFKIYGAAWCSYCKQLVEMLGGYEMVKPIYVECTVEKEECAKADIRAYPTIIINGTRYTGERTIEAFSRATACPPPY
ncbi:MAG: protein disulfide isomerase family protein [Methanocellales archaeon]